MNNQLNPDKLRIVEGSHTTIRQLLIFKKIIYTIDEGNAIHQLLQDELIKWSIDLELINPVYYFSKGKLSNNGKPTTAFKHYLEFLVNLGLIFKTNNIYTNTKLARLFLSLNTEKINSTLNKFDLAFFLYVLVYFDGDFIFLIFNILEENNGISQKEIQAKFETFYVQRLSTKFMYTNNPIAKREIQHKLFIAQNRWANIASYAEHLLVPRLEWLSKIGLINIDKWGNHTNYRINRRGKTFIKQIPKIEDAIYDINDIWIWDNFFSQILKSKTNINMNTLEFKVNNYLNESFKVLSNNRRLDLQICLLYIAFKLYNNENYCINLSTILSIIKLNPTVEDRAYIINHSSRPTDSFISYRLL